MSFTIIFQIIKTPSAEPTVEKTPKVETADSLPKKQNYEWTRRTKNAQIKCPDCDEIFSSRALHKLHICLGKFSCFCQNDWIVANGKGI